MPSSDDLELMSHALTVLEPWVGPLDPTTVHEKESVHPFAYARLRALREEGIDCAPCMHAAIFSWWGKPLVEGQNGTTHCKRCHRSWRGVKEAHCAHCCSHFASNEAASYHWNDGKRGAPGAHTMPEECMRDGDKGPRYTPLETEFGIMWQLTRYVEAS